MTDPNVTPASEPDQQQPQAAPAAGPAAAPAPLTTAEDGQWATLVHFLNIILLIPALVIFLVFKDRGPRVGVESKEALNWTINVSGAVIALNIINAILAFIPIIGLLAWIPVTIVIWAVLICNLIFAIKGGLKVKDGGSYRYPMNHRWIR